MSACPQSYIVMTNSTGSTALYRSEIGKNAAAEAMSQFPKYVEQAKIDGTITRLDRGLGVVEYLSDEIGKVRIEVVTQSIAMAIFSKNNQR